MSFHYFGLSKNLLMIVLAGTWLCIHTIDMGYRAHAEGRAPNGDIANKLIKKFPCLENVCELEVEGVSMPARYSSRSEPPVTVFFRNVGKISISVDTVVIMEQLAFADHCQEELTSLDVIWSRIWPKTVRSGDICELKFLPSQPVESQIIIRLRYWIRKERKEFVFAVSPRTSELRLTGVTFSPGFTRMWLGVVCEGKAQSRVVSVKVNGKEEITNAIVREDMEIADGQVLIIGIPFTTAVFRGEDIFIVCANDLGDTALAHVRADDTFPINYIGNSFTDSSCFDTFPFWFVWGSHHVARLKSAPYLCLMGCPAHKHGTEREASSKLVDAYYSQRRSAFSNSLGYVFVCKAAQERALAIFSPLADGVLTNPIESLLDEGNEARNDHTSILLDSVERCSSASPWYALIPLHADRRIKHLKSRPPTRGETEILLWMSLGKGARGLLFRPERSKNLSSIPSLLWKVQALRPSLALAIPVFSTNIEKGKAHVDILQVGYRELIVIVSNRTLRTRCTQGSPSYIEALADLKVDIPIQLGKIVERNANDANQESHLYVGKDTAFLQIEYLCHVHIEKLYIDEAYMH